MNVWILLTMYTIAILYILFSAPKPSCYKERRDPVTFRSNIIQDNSPTEAEVFKTLKDAGIGPCFLKLDEDNV